MNIGKLVNQNPRYKVECICPPGARHTMCPIHRLDGLSIEQAEPKLLADRLEKLLKDVDQSQRFNDWRLEYKTAIQALIDELKGK